MRVTAETPLVSTNSSSVGGVVDTSRIESLPLNGRQFANLAATIPGVGLGFHSDPTKSTQYSPQITGGNGRNLNYQIDGGDNNDDTVGGLLQLFPLEAIQEFNFVTAALQGGVRPQQRRRDEHRHQERHQRPARQLVRALPRHVDERADGDREDNDVDKQDYRRNQFGGSFGGPIVENKVHFFGAVERTQQDTMQVGRHPGPVPAIRRRLRHARTARRC